MSIIMFGLYMLQCVLQRAGNWRFNAFTLETVTGGKYSENHLYNFYNIIFTIK